jgi:hypothetical protein
MNSRKKLDRVYPVEIHQFFNFPPSIARVDTAFERLTDRLVMMFSGRQWFLFQGNRLIPNRSGRLIDLGLPADLERLDAASVWAFNGRAYLFADYRYWRMDLKEEKVEQNYPKSLYVWKGVPRSPDDSLQWAGDGANYFFKDKLVYILDSPQMQITEPAQDINKLWFANVCPS